MRWLGGLATLGALVLAFVLGGLVRDPADPRYMAYLSVPPPQLAQVSVGFRNLLADLHYIRFSSYWGFQLSHGRHFMNMEPLLHLITELDPKYKQAYELGGLALGDAGDGKAAARLLDAGARRFPEDPWFPYQAGMMLFFFSEDYMDAAHHFEQAARLPGAREEASYMAARMYVRVDRRDLAIATWRRVLRSPDPSMRQVARNALKKLKAND